MINVNNGKKTVIWTTGMTVQDLLHACNFTFPNILVTVNGTVVPRETYDSYLVHDGDDVKVLHFFGGG